MIRDGMQIPQNAVLCYTRPHGPTTWWRVATYPVDLGRALHRNAGRGAAFTYVLKPIDSVTHDSIPEAKHWHVQSEFLRDERTCWQRWDAATNSLQPLTID